jgi:hypothetical protein
MTIALPAALMQHLIRDDGRKALASAENPDPTLLAKRAGRTYWAQPDALPFEFQCQRVTRFEMQLIAQSLWDDDAPSLVERNGSVHDATIQWVQPMSNAID